MRRAAQLSTFTVTRERYRCSRVRGARGMRYRVIRQLCPSLRVCVPGPLVPVPLCEECVDLLATWMDPSQLSDDLPSASVVPFRERDGRPRGGRVAARYVLSETGRWRHVVSGLDSS
jgi:hypothetical protein